MPFPKKWENAPSRKTPIDAPALENLEARTKEAAEAAAEVILAEGNKVQLEALITSLAVFGTSGKTNTSSFASETVTESAVKNGAITESKLASALVTKLAEAVLGGVAGKTTTASFGNETVTEAAIKAKAVGESKLSAAVITKLENTGLGLTEAEVKTLIKSLAVIGASEKTTTSSFGAETITEAAIKAKAVGLSKLSAEVAAKLETAAGFTKKEAEELLAIFPATERAGETYTLVAGDAGQVQDFTNATKIVVTLPANVFTTGQTGQLCQIGAGTMEMIAGSGATILPAGPYIAKERGATVGWRARTPTAFVLAGAF